jgi:hypothetical protein
MMRVILNSGVRFVEGPHGHDIGLPIFLIELFDNTALLSIEAAETHDEALRSASAWAEDLGVSVLDRTEGRR